MTPSQRPHRSSLLRRLLCLLLIQHAAASRLQLRTHLHKGLWHPEDQESPNEKPEDHMVPRIGLPEPEGLPCELNPYKPRKHEQMWITE